MVELALGLVPTLWTGGYATSSFDKLLLAFFGLAVEIKFIEVKAREKRRAERNGMHGEAPCLLIRFLLRRRKNRICWNVGISV